MILVPCFASGWTEPHTTLKLTIAENEKLTKSGCYDNQTSWDWFCWGNRTSSTQRCRCVGYNVCIYFGFYFMSSKWTRTKICVFSALLMAFLHLQHVLEQYGCQRIGHAILIASGLVPIVLCNENHHDGHSLICILG